MTRFAIAFLILVGCSKKSSPPEPEPEPAPAPTAQGAPSPADEAHQLFDTLCSTCHGKTGLGDGVASASLDPKPRNYTDKAWQTSVTDDQIRAIILGGGASVGKSALMPAQPQLKDKPAVIDELVKIVRSFGQ